MFTKNELEEIGEIFGDFEIPFIISTDAETVRKGDEVTLTNRNCEFEFDNIFGVFGNDLYFKYIVELEPVSMDLSGYVREKSNNGGCYGYLTCKVKKVLEKSY